MCLPFVDEVEWSKKGMEASVPMSMSCDLPSTVAAIGMSILTSRMPAREVQAGGDDENLATAELNSVCFKNGALSSSTFQVIPKVQQCFEYCNE